MSTLVTFKAVVSRAEPVVGGKVIKTVTLLPVIDDASKAIFDGVTPPISVTHIAPALFDQFKSGETVTLTIG